MRDQTLLRIISLCVILCGALFLLIRAGDDDGYLPAAGNVFPPEVEWEPEGEAGSEEDRSDMEGDRFPSHTTRSSGQDTESAAPRRPGSSAPFDSIADVPPSSHGSTSSHRSPSRENTTSRSSSMDGSNSSRQESHPSSESASSQAPSTSSDVTSESETSSQPDPAEVQEANERLMRELSERYGLRVALSQEGGDPEPEEVASTLASVRDALAVLPNGFFSDGDEFLLTGSLTDNQLDDRSSGQSFSFLIDCRARVRTEAIRAKIVSAVVRAFHGSVADGTVALDFGPYNPVGFRYGISQRQYLYSRENSYIGCFLSTSAQSDSSADAEELLAALLERGAYLEGVPRQGALFPKLEYVCGVFVKWRPALEQNHTVKYYLGSR